MKNLILTLLILFVSVLLISGCLQNNGREIIPVTGTITKKGQPLVDVRIEFHKTDTGAMSFAETNSTGHFTLIHTHGKKGAEPGKYRVSVFQKGKPIPLPTGVKLEDIPEERRNQMSPDVPITNSDKSPIEVEITENSPNEFNIDLK